MKIEYLEIKNYKQFTDLTLDLTYPKGHEKEGQPLDKICIIGQSGTGKTNLLDIIKKSTIDFSKQFKDSYLPFSEFVGKDTDDRYITTKFSTYLKEGETLFTEKNSKITFQEIIYLDQVQANIMKDINCIVGEKNYYISANRCSNNNEVYDETLLSRTDKSILEGLEKERTNITSLSISYHGGKDKFEKKLLDIDTEIENMKKKYTVSRAIDTLKTTNFINRSIVEIQDNITSIWAIMKTKIDSYNTDLLQIKDKLSNKLLDDDSYDKKHFKNDLNKWKTNNENILEKIADDLNFILNKFNLELTKIDEKQKSYNALIIKDLSNNKILEYDDLSTGTKNLISTFIPLKVYKPKNSIVLIDEPEMSFYPDIQRQLTDLYMNVGENNQLIMATHSPLIASSFEPWEVVELKFDKNNQIYRELYRPEEAENHIDNYTLDPRLLTWTSILVDIFDLKEDSFSLREQKLMEYGMLKAEIKAMEKGEERDEKMKKFKKLSALLGLQN